LILNIFKPKGWTSFKLVKEVKKKLKLKRAGHTGSLDPFAEGVIVICTDEDTKKSEKIVHMVKEYIGTIELGKRTDTDDVEGRIIEEKNVQNYTKEKIQQVLKGFEGEIEQVPPQFSAKKIKGVRAYKLARSGIQLKLKPRKVNIYSIELLDYSGDEIKIKVECSKGTYMRALARDIGEELGCGAYLKSLTRTKVGSYNIDNSVNIENISEVI